MDRLSTKSRSLSARPSICGTNKVELLGPLEFCSGGNHLFQHRSSKNSYISRPPDRACGFQLCRGYYLLNACLWKPCSRLPLAYGNDTLSWRRSAYYYWHHRGVSGADV